MKRGKAKKSAASADMKPLTSFFHRRNSCESERETAREDAGTEEPVAQTTANAVREQPETDANKINNALKKVFKLDAFRGDQLDIVRNAVLGKNLLVIMPTGAGKSLTYQLPAVISRGVSLVVSPLLALIQNQVDALKLLGIKATSLNSTLKESEKTAIYKDLTLTVPTIKMLYVTPELMATDKFREILKFLDLRGMLSRLVIDEAHCISEWGHDFRGDYRKLSYFHSAFPHVPIMALTATATMTVRNDILKQLGIEHDYLLFISSFNRINLDYQVRFHSMTERYADIKETIAQKNAASMEAHGKERATGIIYCGTRDSCEQLSDRLQGDGIRAYAYHAGLPTSLRTCILDAWTLGTPQKLAATKRKSANQDTASEQKGDQEIVCDVVIATVAFGMGIDKKDVRFVIHYDMAQSMEAYYQQAGRAGRDGLNSTCILYFTHDDRERIVFLINKSAEGGKYGNSSKSGGHSAAASRESAAKNSMKAFEAFVKYCENRKLCRHVFIMDYFGEDVAKLSAHEKKVICGGFKQCDICRDPKKVESEWTRRIRAGGISGMDIGKYGAHDGSVRLPGGSWVTYSSNSASQRSNAHQKDISLVDSASDSDGDGSSNRRSKKSRFEALDEDDIEDDMGDGSSTSWTVGQSTSSSYAGFKTASGKQMNDSIPQDPRLSALFNKDKLSTANTANLLQTSSRFPTMYQPPRHGLIRDLPLVEREKCFEKILGLVEKKLGSHLQDLSLRTAVGIETKCYLASKSMATYKMYIGSRMREVAAANFGVEGAPTDKLSIAAAMLESEKLK
ncbi:hypothetical protein CcCBS67573_g04988 [Chytriomyces confervae]|uniref:ATP-dependent DNA helicase n=1 Tax=Chytriomyces confervae TaxID=246404 RepID=A0A507FBL4_9FUNG|nr:hypothetical protein CcCBS67573_g04988 [Chytriomyces confervae]